MLRAVEFEAESGCLTSIKQLTLTNKLSYIVDCKRTYYARRGFSLLGRAVAISLLQKMLLL